MRNLVTVTACTAALLSGAAPALADSSQLWRADYSGTASPTGTGMAFSGSGLATAMGRITTSGEAVITGGSSACDGGIANVNTQTLQAANGDTLTVQSDDVACPDGTPGGLNGSGTWTVVSGTGRFAQMHGTGTMSGHMDLSSGSYTIHLVGTLG